MRTSAVTDFFNALEKRRYDRRATADPHFSAGLIAA